MSGDNTINGGYGHEKQPNPQPGPNDDDAQYAGGAR